MPFMLSLIKGLKDIVTFLEDRWVSPKTSKDLSARFESLWFELDAMKPVQLAIALARNTSDLLDGVFGDAIFSMLAFKRASRLATGMLFFLIFLFICIGQVVNPLTEFTDTVKALKMRPPALSAELKQNEMEKKVAAVAEQLDNGVWRGTYFSALCLTMIVANAGVFFLSLAFSRRILRAIWKAKDVFTSIILLTVNCFAALVAASLLLEFYSIIVFPALSGLPILAYFLTKISIAWLLVSFFNGAVAAWAFGNNPLRFIAAVSVLPSIATILISFLSGIAIWQKKRVHTACGYLLDKGAGQKPISALFGIFVILGLDFGPQ
jgi:hypothetical protein